MEKGVVPINTKTHNINLTISVKAHVYLTFMTSWFYSGRVANHESFCDVLKFGQSCSTRMYESDGALTGCSGYVRYRVINSDFDNDIITIAFSNPLIASL